MGRNHTGITKQVTDRLAGMLACGVSRHAEKSAGMAYNRIYSYGTLHSYIRQCVRFAKECKEKYGARTVEECGQYAAGYLQELIDSGKYSASTIHLATAALTKLYGKVGTGERDPETGVYTNPWGIDLPQRHRDDITRSRGPKVRDAGMHDRRYIRFARATGLRADKEMACLKGNQLRELGDRRYGIEVRGKGGHIRTAPIVGSERTVREVVTMMRSAGDRRVWHHIPSHADTHAYRADYANTVYRMYARPVEELKNAIWINSKTGRAEKAAYQMRKGKLRGIVLDRAAMYQASLALGHQRIDVFANHYFRADR